MRERILKNNAALGARPTLSIRVRIIFAFLLFFLLCLILNIWSIWSMAELEGKVHFLEIADHFMMEVQQARRFEKNFLLYGSNLEDASEHMNQAKIALTENTPTMERVLGKKHLTNMVKNVATYHALLHELGETHNAAGKKQIENDLREYGGQIVAFAEEFGKKERDNVDQMLAEAKRVPFFFLVTLIILMIFIASFLTRQLLFTLHRFVEYAQRIGEGDFSPIVPVRKYKDEFTELAAAFNTMTQELDHRHNILVQSHKLRAVGTLVAGVAHELNNPLNNIMLTAALLKEDYWDISDEEKLQMIEDMISQTERSRKIVSNLLDFARESEAHIKPLQLDKIVRESARLVANELRIKKVILEIRVAEDLPPVHGDEQMLKQVFVNLMLNALEALPPKGRIVIFTAPSEENGFLAVKVQDDGPGIPEHVLAQIFDPFFTTKTKGKGTGLGLSVSRGIIKKLGGHLHVSSQVDVGSSFTVLLPVTNRPAELSMGKTMHQETLSKNN